MHGVFEFLESRTSVQLFHRPPSFKDLEELVTKVDRVFAARTPQLLNSTHFYHLALYNC